jgi:hypothetical protein
MNARHTFAMAMPPPPTAGRPSRSFGSGLVVGLLVAILVAVLAVGYVLGSDRNGTTTANGSSVSPLGSTGPTPSPKPKGPPPLVTRPFSGLGWSRGDRLWFGVGKLKAPDNGCTIHTYTVDGKTHGAYETDCPSWENTGSGYDIILFYVGLHDPTDQAASFDLGNFVLTARDGRTFPPVNVRSHAQYPPNFLPETGKVPPKSNLFGWLTFDGRLTGFVAGRLSYVEPKQTLTVVFDGKHATS